MTRSLRATVHVAGAIYGPGDVPEPEHAELIRNPKAWDDWEDPSAPAPPKPAAPAPAASRPAKKAAQKAAKPAEE